MIRAAFVITSAVSVVALAAPAAESQSYAFRAEGVVTSAYSADRDFKQVPNPSSLIGVGDRFMVAFMLSAAGASPSGLYDADPSINIYYHYVTAFEMRVGSTFVTLPSTGERTFTTIQLWDNYLSGGRPVDYFGLSTLRYLPAGTSPVDLGAGAINTQFHYNAFDNTATARRSDLLTNLPSLDRYDNRSGFFGFLNGDTYLQTTYQLQFTSASLTAVPEPGTWILMITGFGVAGGAVRRSRRRLTRRV